MPLLRIVEGWTGRLEFQLKSDGAPQQLQGTDRIYAWLWDVHGMAASLTTDSVLVLTASCGHVAYYASTTGVFRADVSPYTFRFRVVDGNSDQVWWPNDEPWEIEVQNP